MSNIKRDQAVHILKQGGLVAFPTETVYGLGADARNEQAIKRVFAVKERPLNNPLIVHLAAFQQVKDWARVVPPAAEHLAKVFWPGPLTLVLKKQPHVLPTITANQDTVALRIPQHHLALSLLHQFGDGLVAPSANKFTRLSPTTAQAVYEELGDEVDMILDGGQCEVGLESTIVDMSDAEHIAILRPGMITPEAIANELNLPVNHINKNNTRAPGMHHLHYAPRTQTQFFNADELADVLCETSPIGMITCNLPSTALQNKKNIRLYHLSNHANSYAHDLYQTLRELDHLNLKCIYIENIPADKSWDAVKDRLSKATASFCFAMMPK